MKPASPLPFVLAWLCSVACTATPSVDAGHADATTGDAATEADAPDLLDASPLTDAGMWRAPACGGAAGAELLACPTQDAVSASACGGVGGVLFDGTFCVDADGTECGPERGTFDSFEQCAIACESHGECTEREVHTYPPSEGPYATCVEPSGPRACFGAWAFYSSRDLSGCELGIPVRCAAVGGAWACGEDPPTATTEGERVAELWPVLRRLSLLPFTFSVDCGQLVGP